MSSLRVLVLLCLVAIFGSTSGGKLYHQSFDSIGGDPFSWSDCGNGSLPVVLSDFLLSPDPVLVPGNARVAFEARLTRDVAAPVKVVVALQKYMFEWVTLPCEGGLGSCTYDDVCQLLEKLVCDPTDKMDISCHCPFHKGDYNLTPTTITIDHTLIPLPWTLVRGSYRVHIDVSDAQGKVACLTSSFRLA